jgi:FkbM family methyltransferase
MSLIKRVGGEQINTIVHVGAHFGEEIYLYEQLNPQNVVWVEADPSLCEVLANHIQSISPQSKQICVNALVSNRDNQETPFYRFNNWGASSSMHRSTSLLRETWEGLAESGDVLRMSTLTLSTILKGLNLHPEQIDVIVIDIQGSELLCLEGMGDYGDHVRWIEVECSQERIYEGGSLFPEVDQHLRGKGFRRVSGIPWHGNCLYERVDNKGVQGSIDPGGPRILANLRPLIHETYRSQCGQDYWIHKKYFSNKPNGFFIDVGANNGVELSSTYFFEKFMGWQGICIEPNPACFPYLYSSRSCLVIPCAIADSLGIAEFQQVTGGLNTLSSLKDHCDPRHARRVQEELEGTGQMLQTIKVLQVPLSEILRSLGVTRVDFLKIDVEGAELAVLKSIDWSSVSISIIEVEDNYGDSGLHSYLKDKGYVLDSIFDSFVYVYAHKSRFFSP